MSLDEQVNKLWEALPHPSGAVVRLFAKKGNVRIGDFARSPKEIIRFVNATGEMDKYVAPNPTECTTGIRHSAKDVTHWSYFFIDADPVDSFYNPFTAINLALERFSDWTGKDFLDLRPFEVSSGRGVQAWIRLEDIKIDDETVWDGPVWRHDGIKAVRSKAARKVNGYWLNKLAQELDVSFGCRIDTTVSDLPRVMRLPGTVNSKTGREAVILQPLCHPSIGLADILCTGVPESVFSEPEPGQVKAGIPWQLAFNELTYRSQQYLTLGREEPGRHATMWHTAQNLFEIGVSREEAEKALRRADGLLGPDKALGWEQVEKDLLQVYGKP